MGWEDYKAALKTAAVSVATVWTVAPLLYYSHCELQRYRQLKRRDRTFKRALEHLERRKTLELPPADQVLVAAADGDLMPSKEAETAVREIVGNGTGLKREVDEELFEIVKSRFASMRIGGRYQNPFFEWHEEGAWEWFIWKCVQTPFFDVLPTLLAAPFSSAARTRVVSFFVAPSPPTSDPLYTRYVPDWTHLFGLSSSPAQSVLAPAPEECVVGFGSVAQNGIVAAPPPPTPFAPLASTPFDLPAYSLLPPTTPDAASPSEASLRIPSRSSVTWIGHATAFCQIDGLCVLTDPLFSDRTADIALAPKRIRGREVPCALRDLVRIDVVIVSHSHYDHLDVHAVEYLRDTVLWLIPLGLGDWFRALGVTNFREMDWWDRVRVPIPGSETGESVEFVTTPTMHWTARTPFDVNRSLWCSFSILGPRTRVLHVGDTGYVSKLFSLVGRLFGPYDLVLLPIGAYRPRWHLRVQHVDPSDAVQILDDVRGRKGLGVHWGTFGGLSDEDWREPPVLLEAARKERGWEEGRVSAVPMGKTILI